VHGSEIAALVDIYVGHAHVRHTPKVRLERLIYRGIRDAANASRSIEQREHARKVSDLRESLRTRGVYVEYHPIVVTNTRQVFGYEALARGSMRSLRRPEVMFEVAASADLVWELSRLCRSRAIEGMKSQLRDGELLFINIDPHDFSDPDFNEAELDVEDPRRIVIEITERTAITDYPKFRERLAAFRERGYRFAVDDAGSGYAGLGSIANLEPDFIKLDISLINGIDENFIKQNLVETMVRFANDQGAMVIAEGVEREEEYQAVKLLGVHLVQGFLLHDLSIQKRSDEVVSASSSTQPATNDVSRGFAGELPAARVMNPADQHGSDVVG
jgi:EAL domain-containing protein (putative c-di-GMP-specific phosphodiesterase class I)